MRAASPDGQQTDFAVRGTAPGQPARAAGRPIAARLPAGRPPQRDRQQADRQQGDWQQGTGSEQGDCSRAPLPGQPAAGRSAAGRSAAGGGRGRTTRRWQGRAVTPRPLPRPQPGRGRPGRRVHRARPSPRSARRCLVPVPDLDILDSCLVRTSGYLPGSTTSTSTGESARAGCAGDASRALRQPREGSARRSSRRPPDTVNGAEPEKSRNRVEFQAHSALPAGPLRLETDRDPDARPTSRPSARVGLTSRHRRRARRWRRATANAISTNNPEVHLMVALVDERPEIGHR
jgi:transcription termination factor Rho